MPDKSIDSLERDQRLQDVVLGYLKAIDAGQTPDQQDLLARHPEMAADLKAFFADQDGIQSAVGQLRGPPAEPRPAFSRRIFGNYELLKVIGEGGMGIVFKARQFSPPRVVVLKMIRAGQLASAEDVERFRTEAQFAASLDHPNIVPIYEVGEHDGQPYFTMKRIESGSLAQHLSLFVNSPKASARLVAKVARAVHHAHLRGILHRDLKPANILLDGRGKPHVTDFGLAKLLEGDAGLTHTGAIVGTIGNMSPEQATAKKGLTTAADVYGLGTILYELLTGQPLFRAETVADMLRQVQEREPQRPRALKPRLDRDLETICLKCLEKDPVKRYASAEALAEDLEYWLVGEPIEGRRSSVWERGHKWAKRRPAVATLAGICAAALLGLIALMIALWANAEKRAEAVQELTTAQGKLAGLENVQVEVQRLDKIAQEADEAKRWPKYLKDMRDAQKLLDRKEIQRTLLILESYRPQMGQKDLRGFEWHYLWRICHPKASQAPLLLRGHTGWVTSLALSSDGTTLATGDDGGTVRLWDLSNGLVIHTPQKHKRPVNVAFAPNGKVAVSASLDGAVKVWQVPSGIELFKVPDDYTPVYSVAFAPDSSTVALARVSGFVEFWDVETGKKKLSLKSHEAWRTPREPLGLLAFSPDGKMLASLGGGGVKVSDIATKKNREFTDSSYASFPESVVFSPDGKILAAGNWNSSINLWDVTNGNEIIQLTGHTGHVFPLAFSPDGNTLASGSEDASIKLWDLVMKQERFTLKGHTGRVTCLAFSSDSKLLASGSSDGTVKLWDARLASGEPPSAQVRAEWVREMERRARSLKVFRMEGGKSVPVPLLDQPLLHYDDPPRDLPEATLWAFGRQGRPAALVSLEFAPRPQGGVLGVYEFLSLSNELVTAEGGDDGWRWSPQRAGVELQQFPGAPAPAATDSGRLQQMKNLALRLTAWERTELEAHVNLPLLEEPIYRYADPAAGLQDGAIFVIAHGTNPEVALLFESSGQSWRYGLGQLTSAEVAVNLDGRQVWQRNAGQQPDDVYWAVTEPYLSKGDQNPAGKK
jgi:tRNA A-37 threonylcarbamoyl transferase component Bud32